MRYCVLKSVHRCVLYACSKHHYGKKRKVIGRTPKGYISPIWGEAPSNPIVTKYGLWVHLPDVINCAKFHLYRANSFWVTGPQKMGVPIDLRGDLYNS